MKNSYDYTKDEKYKSYEQFVYNSLIKLGFRITNVGTMYLKDLILFTHFNNYYEINVTKLVKDYMKHKNINHISERTFINCINYSIKSAEYKKFNYNFEIVFDVEFNEYFNSAKNIILFFSNVLNFS